MCLAIRPKLLEVTSGACDGKHDGALVESQHYWVGGGLCGGWGDFNVGWNGHGWECARPLYPSIVDSVRVACVPDPAGIEWRAPARHLPYVQRGTHEKYRQTKTILASTRG